MAERVVRVPRVPEAPRQRVPVLVVVWPPIAPGRPFFLEVRAPRDSIDARLVTVPILHLDSTEADLLGEAFIETKIPRSWRPLLLPEAVRLQEAVKLQSPLDYAQCQYELELFNAIKGFCDEIRRVSRPHIECDLEGSQRAT